MINKNYSPLFIEEIFLFNMYGTHFEQQLFKHFRLSGNTRAIKKLSQKLKKKIDLL